MKEKNRSALIFRLKLTDTREPAAAEPMERTSAGCDLFHQRAELLLVAGVRPRTWGPMRQT